MEWKLLSMMPVAVPEGNGSCGSRHGRFRRGGGLVMGLQVHHATARAGGPPSPWACHARGSRLAGMHPPGTLSRPSAARPLKRGRPPTRQSRIISLRSPVRVKIPTSEIKSI